MTCDSRGMYLQVVLSLSLAEDMTTRKDTVLTVKTGASGAVGSKVAGDIMASMPHVSLITLESGGKLRVESDSRDTHLTMRAPRVHTYHVHRSSCTARCLTSHLKWTRRLRCGQML